MTSVTREDVHVRIEGDEGDFRTKEIRGQAAARVPLSKGADRAPALEGPPEDIRSAE